MFKLPDQPEKLLEDYINQYGEKVGGEKYKQLLLATRVNPLKYFCPNLVQEKAIKETAKAMKESPIATVLLTCGNGVGKTIFSAQTLGNIVYGVQNDWFNYPAFRHFDYPRQGWLITSPSNLDENYFNEASETSLYSIFRNKKMRPEKEGKQHINSVYFDDANFKLSVKTFNQAPSEFESVTLGVVIIDEPCPQNIWEKIPARLRQGGLILMPMTPLDVDPYVVQDVMDKAEKNVIGHKHIRGDAFEVTKDRERGHYDKEVLEQQIARMDKDMVDARVHGLITHFRERIYPELNRDIHFVDPKDYPIQSNYLFYHVVDPHDSRPNAEIWAARTPEGRWIIFDERPEEKDRDFWNMRGGEDIHSHMKRVQFKEEELASRFGFPISPERIFDRHFSNQVRGTQKTSLVEDYEKEGWPITNSYEAQHEVEYGHDKVKTVLRYLPDGKPGLVIWNNCKHTWNGLKNYIRKRRTSKSDMEKPLGEGKIKEKYKDFPDVVRILACHNVVDYGETVNYHYKKRQSALDYV